MMRVYKSLLMAAAVAALSLGLASCTDKIDNSTGPSDNPQEQQAGEAQTKAGKFWAVVSQLVDVDDYTDDYEDKTFEPTYGVSQGGAGTRYVYTNDAATAVKRFADLVERDDIDENTETYTYSDPNVGTLIYKKGTGRVLAEVDVDIKQIPGLKKIVYVPGAYANGNFSGRAYYRFGDVVCRQVDGQTEYWICVRPSFGMEGKGDSHWVCLNALPEKNVEHYHSDTNGKDYYMPKGLGTNKEQMQNLAEMLYAIYFPEEWEANVKDVANTDLRMFYDLNKANYEYHNQFFWKNVHDAWKKAGILESILNYTLGESAFKAMLRNEGLHLLYYGYSWWWHSSWDCTLTDAGYKNGESNGQKNLHQATYKDFKHNMKDIKLDCRRMGQRNIINYREFFGDNYVRWAVRHATGRELASDGRYNEKMPIAGVTTLYRYYQDVAPTEDLSVAPEKTNYVSNAPTDGAGAYMLGDVVKDEYDNRWFCITGSPWLTYWNTVTDKAAWFVTLDFNGINTDGNTVEGLPTEAELPELTFRLAQFFTLISKVGTVDQFDFDPNGPLGTMGQHVKDYAGVDLHHLYVCRDSIWSFTTLSDGKNRTFNSVSRNEVFCLAYQDGTGRQAIARVVLDFTQAGNERNYCQAYDQDGNPIGKKLQYWFYRIYKHYELPEPMRQATDVEAALGMNAWCLPWTMSTQKMYLDDVTNAELVGRFAKNDKWVTLPHINTQERRQPRTQVEASSTPADYIGHYQEPVAHQKLNMFNEPVLFLRVMKVDDNKSPYPNLTSQDNRHLSVVNMLNIKSLYKGGQQGIWVQNYDQDRQRAIFVDNVLTVCPPIPGWPQLE